MKKAKLGNTKSPLSRKPSRRPGQSSEEKLGILKGQLLLWVVMIAVLIVIIFIEWMYYFIKIRLQPLGATILAVCFLIFSWWKTTQIKKEIQNYQLGRDGEREVAECPENLIRHTGCYVYHDIICERNDVKFNIDHIIVSKFGVFVIETKARSKTEGVTNKVEDFNGKSVKLTGHPPDSQPIEQARRNAVWLRDKVPFDIIRRSFVIIAIVVYPGWWVDKEIVRNSKDVWVSNAKYLEFSITQLKPSFTSEEVEVINNKVKEFAGTVSQSQE